jgi:GH25 family lysozyme M1 (1,4-beta-N-acetylmuramidase)
MINAIGVDYASIDGNHAPDWKLATSRGRLRFAICRGAWGTYKDPNLPRDRDAAEAAGVVFGAYLILRYHHLGQKAPQPEDQAEAFLEHYGPRRHGELPPGIDIEFPGRGISDTGMHRAAVVDWINRADKVLADAYGTRIPYTSARVMSEDLGNSGALALDEQPLWVKTPYAWRGGSPVHLEAAGALVLPPMWHGNAWIRQFQGDAIGFPGFDHTVDVNEFLPMSIGEHGDRVRWAQARLRAATWLGGFAFATMVDGAFDDMMLAAVTDFQRARGLVDDGVIGPRTFALLA